ncbi:hypothetical protein Tco_0144204 [Tanacetum coccineum]
MILLLIVATLFLVRGEQISVYRKDLADSHVLVMYVNKSDSMFINSSSSAIMLLLIIRTDSFLITVTSRGLPKRTGILKSSRTSSTLKSMGKMNLLSFIRRFLTIPFGMHLELSARSMFILIVSSFPIPRHLYIEKGMMLMLAPKSAKALLKSNLPIKQGRIKLPGYFSFRGSWLRRRADHL